MTWMSPGWLVLLAPWALLALWLMLGQRRQARVPFVELWRATEAARTGRRFVPPPVAIFAMLGAVLLAILAAAGPVIRAAASSQQITVILDRGITMSPGQRRAEVIAAAQKLLAGTKTVPRFAVAPLAKVSSWQDLLNAPATAVDASADLRRAIAEALEQSAGPVIVLSDQRVRFSRRLVYIAPTAPIINVAIARIALRTKPATQAMVAVRNDSPLTTAELLVDRIRRPIDLPPRGQEKNFFIDLPAAGATMRAELEVADEFEGDNAAWLVRQSEGARIEPRGNLAPAVRRMVEAYSAARPAAESADVVLVTPVNAPSDQRAIISPPAAAAVDVPLTVRDHPITAHLNPAQWKQIQSADAPAGNGWNPVVEAGPRPLVAVRESPARQVWIGARSDGLARTPEFVILWTNALDWVSAGRAKEEFVATDVGRLAPEWKPQSGRDLWPGLYVRSDGALVAANAPPIPVSSISPSLQSAEDLPALPPVAAADFELAPYLAVLASACALAAAWLLPRRILTAFSAPRTV